VSKVGEHGAAGIDALNLVYEFSDVPTARSTKVSVQVVTFDVYADDLTFATDDGHFEGR
jgi:hypothetical protein